MKIKIKKVRNIVKYLVFPGYTLSKNDGDEHYISDHQLIDLYKVSPNECRIMKHEKDFRGININDPKWVKLYSMYNGNYNI